MTPIHSANLFKDKSFVAIASTQIEKQAEFYRLFFSTEASFQNFAYAEFYVPGIRLAIFTPKAENAAEFAASASGPMSLCLEVDNLESAIAHLKSIGHAPPGEIMHTSHGQEIYAYDPDGNRLILHQSPS